MAEKLIFGVRKGLIPSLLTNLDSIYRNRSETKGKRKQTRIAQLNSFKNLE